MDRLSSVLPKVLRKRGLATEAESALAVHRVRQWIGGRLPQLHDGVDVSKCRDGVLFLTCAHSVALQECRSLLPELRRFLDAECGFAGISEIRIGRS